MIKSRVCENIISEIEKVGAIGGIVHSVYKNALNIEYEDKLIGLINNKKMAPWSISIDLGQDLDFLKLNIKKDMRVIIDKNCIKILDNNIDINMEVEEIWNPKPIFNLHYADELQFLNNINIFEKVLMDCGKFQAAGPLITILKDYFPELLINLSLKYPLDKSYQFIRNRFVKFIDLLIKEDYENIPEAASLIIGFGAGLTPSMDDLICGLMESLIYCNKCFEFKTDKILKMNSEIVERAAEKTTRVSEEMLKYAALGEVSEITRNLIISIISYDNSSIYKDTKEIIHFGETSGTDIAFGIYLGCKIVNNKLWRDKRYAAKC